MEPQVTVTRQEWGVEASCSCGWSVTVPETGAEASAHIMAVVDTHLEAHRRARG